jgi:putative molybdopterin biosynthesis protein
MDTALHPRQEIAAALRRLAPQEQSLEVVDRDQATVRFHQHLVLAPLGHEAVPLDRARGRVLAVPAVAEVDVPGFDRATSTGLPCAPPIRLTRAIVSRDC